MLRAWESGEQSLAPFVRYEEFNTAASFEPVPLGLGVPSWPTEKVWTVGVNYYLTPQVVFKADYQKYQNRARTGLNEFHVSLGYIF